MSVAILIAARKLRQRQELTLNAGGKINRSPEEEFLGDALFQGTKEDKGTRHLEGHGSDNLVGAGETCSYSWIPKNTQGQGQFFSQISLKRVKDDTWQ